MTKTNEVYIIATNMNMLNETFKIHMKKAMNIKFGENVELLKS